METVAAWSLIAYPHASGSPLPSSSLSIRASVPTVSSSPRHGVARPQSRSRVYIPSIISCTPGWGKDVTRSARPACPLSSPSLPVLLGSSPSFLNNRGCSSQPPHKGQLPVPAHLPVLELDQVGKLRPRDWRELNQGHRTNHQEDQHSSLNPCDLKFVIWPYEPGRVQGKCFRGTLPLVAPTTCR